MPMITIAKAAQLVFTKTGVYVHTAAWYKRIREGKIPGHVEEPTKPWGRRKYMVDEDVILSMLDEISKPGVPGRPYPPKNT